MQKAMDLQKLELKLEVRPTVRARSPRELLIFSLDDTLIDTSLYWLARKALARAVATKARSGGEMIEAWDEEGRVYECSAGHESVTQYDMWTAFRTECNLADDGDNELRLQVARALRGKFPPAIPGAEDLLKWAQSRFTVAMLTSGDSAVQLQKIEAAKLGGYFKKIKVVPSKTTEDYLALIADMAFSPRNTWVMGSSARLDINSAVAAGANCIHYASAHAALGGPPEKLEQPNETAFRVHNLADAQAILARR